VTGFLLGTCFAAGLMLVWVGITQPAVARGPGRLPFRGLLEEAGVRLSPPGLLLAVAVAGSLGGLLVWWVVDVPVLVLAGVAGGVWAPLAWLRARRDRARRERERAWPAAVDQLADALEAGLALPAAVALVGQAGPEPLRADFAAFHARVRASGLAAAVDRLAAVPERAADTVALLLRAGLVELPAGGLAPALRDLARVLFERFEAREKARTRSASLQLEAAVLAVSPVLLVIIVGLASPAYLDAYRTPGGTLVGALAAVLIAGCYVLMRRLGRVPQPTRSGGQR
jgi:tight adherence protein B